MQVQVEIYEEDKNSMRTEMSGAGKKVIAKEIFSNPNENLILVQEGEKKGGKGPKVEDKRKKESEKEEDEESDDSEKDGEGGENEEGKDKEPHRREALNPFEEYLNEAIEEGEKEEERLEEEERKRTPEYQRKQEKERKVEELLEKIRKNRTENGEPQSSDSENVDRELIQSYQNLEQKLTPFVHEMVKHWEQIVKNITEHIDIFKDKYFREGKPDYKEMQK